MNLRLVMELYQQSCNYLLFEVLQNSQHTQCSRNGVSVPHWNVEVVDHEARTFVFRSTTKRQTILRNHSRKCGVDLFIDNVGGSVLDAAMYVMKDHGRVIICGSIQLYNEEKPPQGPRLEPFIIFKRLTLQGFVRDLKVVWKVTEWI